MCVNERQKKGADDSEFDSYSRQLTIGKHVLKDTLLQPLLVLDSDNIYYASQQYFSI